MGRFVSAGVLGVGFLFIYLPVFVLVLFSFQAGNLPVPPFRGPSLQWYVQMLGNQRLMDALVNSVVVAFVSALAATLLGFLGAYGLARRRSWHSPLVQFLFMAPITVSYIIIGLGLLVAMNVLGVSRSLVAVAIGHTVINLPICFAILYAQFGEEIRNLERAARDLGASDVTMMVRVVAPVVKPALFAAFCLSATLSWDEFIIAFLLTRFDLTLPVVIFEMLRAGLTPEVNAAGTVVFAISMLMVATAAAIMFFATGRKR